MSTMTRTLMNLTTPFLLLCTVAVFSCQPKAEEGSIASTHPELADDLAEEPIPMPVSDNVNPDLYQRYQITMEEYQRSGQFDVGAMYGGELAPLDENSHADTRTYRTALTEGLKAGVNFAGTYTVVTVGCGTSCQMHYVVDRQTGKVLDKLQSNAGATYTIESRLFIINPPGSTVDYSACRDCMPEAYVFEDGRFSKLATVK